MRVGPKWREEGVGYGVSEVARLHEEWEHKRLYFVVSGIISVLHHLTVLQFDLLQF